MTDTEMNNIRESRTTGIRMTLTKTELSSHAMSLVCFVNFTSQKALLKALEKLQDTMYDNRAVVVQLSSLTASEIIIPSDGSEIEAKQEDESI